MEAFRLYLPLGLEHITDPAGYDHILFLLALTARFELRHWKPLLILVTAFTLGHSLTLALATLDYIRISTAWIEWLIPVTIVMTALLNFWVLTRPDSAPLFAVSVRQGLRAYRLHYAAAAFFGLIHGLGFSNFLRSLLGREADLVLPLFAFNVGLELGQLVVVALALLFIGLLTLVPGVRRQSAALFASGLAAGPAIVMVVERWP